jgi:hypothetical protein
MSLWDWIYQMALTGKPVDVGAMLRARNRIGPGQRSCVVEGRRIEDKIVQENLRKGKGRWGNSNGRLELRTVAIMRKTSEPMGHGLKRDHKEERRVRKARWFYAMRRGRDGQADSGH